MRTVTIIFAFIISLFANFQIEGKPKMYLSGAGLEDNVLFGARNICMDSYGRIWVATYYGVYSYDGLELERYDIEYGETKNFNSQNVIHVECDAFDNIWACTIHGEIIVKSSRSDSFQLLKIGMPVSCFHIIDDQRTLLLNNSILRHIVYDPSGDIVGIEPDYTVPPSVSTKISAIISRNDGDCLAITENGIYNRNNKILGGEYFCASEIGDKIFCGSTKGKIVVLDRYNDSTTLCLALRGNIKQIVTCQDNSNILFVSDSEDKAALYDLLSQSITFIDNYPHGTNAFYDKRGILWIYGEVGLFWYDAESNSFVQYENNDVKHNWNDDNRIAFLLQDDKGIFWVCSRWNGLEALIPSDISFKFIDLSKDLNSARDCHVRALSFDQNGRLWYGTESATVNILSEDGRIIRVLDRPKSSEFVKVRAMICDHNGNIWVGIKRQGLTKITNNGETNKFVIEKLHEDADAVGVVGRLIEDLAEDNHHNLWCVSSDMGLSVAEIDKSDDFFNLTSSPNNEHILPSNLSHVFCSEDGVVYVWGESGIYYCDNTTCPVDSIKFVEYSPPSGLAFRCDIQALISSEDNNLIFGTNGIGVIKEKGNQITTESGLLSNYVKNMSMDIDNNLWIATESGLNLENKTTGRILIFSDSNIGMDATFSYGSPKMDSKGEMFFCTNKGILHFDPRKVLSEHPYAKINIKECIRENRLTKTEENLFCQSFRDELTMYDFERITISFITDNLIGNKYIKYYCMVEGGDEKWRELDEKQPLVIQNMKAGRYSVKVMSTNTYGEILNNEEVFYIKVQQAKWEIYLPLSIVLLILIIYINIMVRKKKKLQMGVDYKYIKHMRASDRPFAQKLLACLRSHIFDSQYGIDNILNDMNMGRTKLFTETKQVFGMTPIELLHKIRFEKAEDMLSKGEYSVKQISYLVGYGNPQYFSNSFKKRYGKSPGLYRKERSQL